MKIAGTSLKPLEVWRDDVTLAEAQSFGSSMLATFVRGARGAQVGRLGMRPEQPMILYAIETCPYSRLVRETLSELDIDVLIKPCPKHEPVHRAELERASGAHKVPFLIDPNTGRAVGESRDIVAYLFRHYGDGHVPMLLSGKGIFFATSRVASELRGGIMYYERPARVPEKPLELFGYEASPYCRFVRERLDQLGIAYMTRNLARKSARRSGFEREHGKVQFPYLFDPNTGSGMFETADILAYVDNAYTHGRTPTENKPQSKKRSRTRKTASPPV
jgi:glutathione S-transferase